MDVRVVATEVLAIGLTTIFFINIFITAPLGIIGRIAIFIVFLVLAAYLIRGVLIESKQREELSRLNSLLSQKVFAQTMEIRAAYETEKAARHDLEKLNESKDQFIMLTQHHMRMPISNIIWELESVISGVCGKISEKTRRALEDAKASAGKLTRIVEDLLYITAFKAGASILDLRKASLKAAIEDGLSELKNDIERMDIAVSYPTDAESWPELAIDEKKIREAIFTVLENAVRYNRQNGSIAIATDVSDDDFILTIENTGIGILPEEKEAIAPSLFYRGTYARSAYPTGMGVGLTVAKAMVKAHKGELTIDSEGEGKGASVRVRVEREKLIRP
ncbi:MAG: HAMP domain-containing sensor histidine kinase [Candidatus Taylorbacteria bacterium]|nr:HAMP domain-containing sensor histidine kinase [Candidatus Taylorbacteria bacterium]